MNINITNIQKINNNYYIACLSDVHVYKIHYLCILISSYLHFLVHNTWNSWTNM